MLNYVGLMLNNENAEICVDLLANKYIEDKANTAKCLTIVDFK